MKRGEYVYYWLRKNSNYFPEDKEPTAYDIDVFESLTAMISVQHLNGWLCEIDPDEYAKRKPIRETTRDYYPMNDGGRKAKT
jgi:hypothetical protein